MLGNQEVWSLIDRKCTASALNVSKVQLRNLMGVISGHWLFAIDARILNIPLNDFCRNCKDKEEETTEQLLYSCGGYLT